MRTSLKIVLTAAAAWLGAAAALSAQPKAPSSGGREPRWRVTS